MSKKTGLLICLVIFLSAIAYGLVQAGVVNFVDGINIQYAETIYEDQVPSKAEAENLLMPLSGSLTPSAHLEKNAGGCRIKSGTFYIDYTTVHFWQGYYWGSATAIATSTTDNSCICPTGTTRVLRRSQANNQISELDTTWWKDFRWVNRGLGFGIQGELVWTTQCTIYSHYLEPGTPLCPGESYCCWYVYNNCKSLFSNGQGPGCGGSQPIYYTEYLYNCVATSETLKQ
jgi:hypothetical protein